MDAAAPKQDDDIETTIREEAQRIGKFALIERLGKGASGTVYKALDTFSGQEVALKVLDASLFGREGMSDIVPPAVHERGLARRAPAASAHRRDPGGLASTRNPATSRSSTSPGGDLSRAVQPDGLLRIGGGVRDRLQVLRRARLRPPAGHHPPRHQAGQPDARRGHAIKIVDFGAALLSNTAHTQLQDVGTPSYMSPEQVRGGEHAQLPERHVLARRGAVRPVHRARGRSTASRCRSC